MKKMLIVLMVALPSVGFFSCEELDDITAGLSNEEVVEGLKSALNVGTDTSVIKLNALDGYYQDELVKIFLPDEAAAIVDNVSKVPGLNLLVEEAVKAVNRAAEDAAIEAKPIFVDAIKNITIADGFTILNGADDEATKYLQGNTETALVAAFSPKIETSLNKKLVGNVSAESAYATVIQTYNDASLGGVLWKKVETNSLSEHTTQKALDGLFVKVAEEEGKIRNNVAHRVNDILKKVFGK